MSENINKIYVDGTIEILSQSVYNLCFSDGLLLSKKHYSLVDNTLHINTPATDNVSLYHLQNCGVLYEYQFATISNNSLITGADLWGNTLTGLLNNSIIIFLNGKLLSSDNFVILSDNSIRLLITSTAVNNTIQIFVSQNIVYGGIIDNNLIINNVSSNNEVNLLLNINYSRNNTLIFKNGHLLSSKDIVNFGEQQIQISTYIDAEKDKIEYYTINGNINNYIFDASLGYVEYGPYDNVGVKLPVYYDTLVKFSGVTKTLIDNPRPGFYIREEGTDGLLIIVDDNYETSNLKCITLTKFAKNIVEQNSYYLTVPDGINISHYISEYDKKYRILPEVLGVFKDVILNEVYDECKRLQNLRSLHKVDSKNINKLLSLLGFNIDISNFDFKSKQNILDELSNFYKIVGTEKSYDFFNIIFNTTRIVSMEQLFTYFGSDESTQREYVDFYTKGETGAIEHKEYIIPTADYGNVEYVVQDKIDWGYITGVASTDHASTVGVENWGKVNEALVGRWVEYVEWTRPSNLYPTNHVELQLSIPAEESYYDFMEKFLERFYNLASTVLYIDRIIQLYSYGINTDYTTGTLLDDTALSVENSVLGIMTAPVGTYQRYQCTSDPFNNYIIRDYIKNKK